MKQLIFSLCDMKGAMKSIEISAKMLLVEGWKRDVAVALKSLGLVDDRYTGKIVLNFNRGAIIDVERTERLK